MSARALFDAALDAARDWHARLPTLRDFCDWPTDIAFSNRPAATQPVIPHLLGNPGRTSAASQPLLDAILALAPHLEWRLTYTKNEVGADFLQRYGWFELVGPTGHFLSHQVRMTVGYWGPHLDYGRHQHKAEEIYSVISGSGMFLLDDAPTLTLGPGGTRLHPSDQPHAMQTLKEPILTFVLWRGEGLADAPRMSR